MTEHDTTEKVEQTETGYELSIRSKRGTGTRDEDTVKAKAKTATLEELEEERERLNAVVRDAMNMRRSHQPDGNDD